MTFEQLLKQQAYERDAFMASQKAEDLGLGLGQLGRERGLATPTPIPEIPSLIQALERGTNKLRESVETLGQKIAPTCVALPPQINEAASPARPGADTELGGALLRILDALADTENFVRDITDRVRL